MGKLIVNRKPGERVRLVTPAGEIIWVTYHGKGGEGGAAKLIIEAELAVEIMREEMLPEEKNKNKAIRCGS